MRFLSERELKGLKEYQYKASGYTILDDLHNPVWTCLVNLLPMWLAPNLITLAASACIAAAYTINIVYLPNFTGEAPPWVYLATALSVVAYVNLDCMDGKQARRTGSSSPLGQLFDHGCDALVLHMMLGNIASSLGVACSWKMAAGCMGILVPWILAQWEEYHTGVMMYGTGLYGVLEANYSICVVHLLTYFLAPSMWLVQLPLPAVLHDILGATASIADLSLAVVSAAGIAQACHNIYRVLVAPAARLPCKEAGAKALGRGPALRHLTGFGVMLSLGCVLLSQAQGHDAWHCRLAFATFGVLYALAATQLIIAHMCKEPLAPPWLPMLLLLVAVLPVPEAVQPYMVPVVSAVAIACYLVYVLSIIGQISTSLGIKVLTIKPRLHPTAAPTAAAAAANSNSPAARVSLAEPQAQPKQNGVHLDSTGSAGKVNGWSGSDKAGGSAVRRQGFQGS